MNPKTSIRGISFKTHDAIRGRQMRSDQVDLETPAISALAAVSKIPFRTAFKVTLGIGLARLFMFLMGLAAIVGAVLFYGKITK